jgi:hypothetical protein
MDLQGTVENAMGGLENLIAKIPGYSGYKQKENRRQADLLLREHVARQFETQWRGINDLKSQMLTGPAMTYLDDIGQASRRLQTLIDQIKGAAQGYAGFFDAVKVKEQELDALYEFDNNLLLEVDQVQDAISGVQSALDSGLDGDIAPAIRNLTKVITGLKETFGRRRDVITDMY